VVTNNLQVGERVKLSARYLRSLGTVTISAGNSGWSIYDKGVGTVVGFDPDIPFLARVWWDEFKFESTYNVENLVRLEDAHLEAMNVEHS
jgi:hypothetical protein